MSANLADARKAEMAALVERHDGIVTPAMIVAFATDPKTALHSLFTWDDTEAAKQYREQQARDYLRAVVRVIPRENNAAVSVRAFVSLTSDRGPENIYRPIERVLSDEDMRAQLVADALSELRALSRKYGHLQELAQVWVEVDQLVLIAA